MADNSKNKITEDIGKFTKKASINPAQQQLPLFLLSSCPKCETIGKSQIINEKGVIKIARDCEKCGENSEVLNDSIFSDSASKNDRQPEETLTGSKIFTKIQGFPKTVQTLCPECKKVILGIEYVRDNKVFMEKTCPEHGYCTDLLYSDAALLRKLEKWGFEDNAGLSNPKITNATNCPDSCGLCNLHTSHTCLGVVDLTNRCNLKCPICFANSNTQGYVFEPSFEQVVTMMQTLRDEKPTPAVAVQFSGGEPTLHPRFLDILKKAKELGFSHVQLATNGLNFLDLEFVKKCEKAGLHQIYLQFDGFDDEAYKQTRGTALLEKKLKIIDNIRQTDMKICLVPTIVKGVNDKEVVPIIKFAIENSDVISAISFQPVAFTGRIDYEKRIKQRFTLADMASLMDLAGIAKIERDFYPLSMVAPFSRLIEAITGQPKITMSAHTHCSTASYFLIDKDKKAYPFTSFLDVEGLMTEINEKAPKMKKARFKLFTKIQALNFMRKYYTAKKAPNGLSFLEFLKALQGLTDKKLGRGEAGKKNYRTLLVAGMHFMDAYNYDVERVKRCLIHYPSVEGKLYPFCTYNSGPFYRERIEKKFSIPLDEWRKQNPNK